MINRQRNEMCYFDISGIFFYLARQKVECHPEITMAAMATNRFAPEENDDGYMLVDRNPSLFGLILDFLRHSRMYLPATDAVYNAVLREVAYCGVLDLQPRRKLCILPYDTFVTMVCPLERESLRSVGPRYNNDFVRVPASSARSGMIAKDTRIGCIGYGRWWGDPGLGDHQVTFDVIGCGWATRRLDLPYLRNRILNRKGYIVSIQNTCIMILDVCKENSNWREKPLLS